MIVPIEIQNMYNKSFIILATFYEESIMAWDDIIGLCEVENEIILQELANHLIYNLYNIDTHI